MAGRLMTPELEDLFRAWLDHYAVEHRGPQPGRIESYDPVLQVADVQPMLRTPVEQPDGTFVQRAGPVVPCVPVMFQRTRGWFTSLPVEPGDFVLLVPCEGCWSEWWVGPGEVTNVADLRRHHLAHCVAIPGLYPERMALRHAGPVGDDDGARLVIGQDTDEGTRLSIMKNGTVRITQGALTVVEVDTDGVVHIGGVAGDFVALAGSVATQLTALKTAINGAVVVAGDGGASFKSTLMAALASWPSTVAATKAKAT